MIILDTNVISELLRPAPEPKVEHWLSAQDGLNVYLTSISEAELRYGLAMLLESGRLHSPPIAPGLWRQVRQELSPYSAQTLAALFGTHQPPWPAILCLIL